MKPSRPSPSAGPREVPPSATCHAELIFFAQTRPHRVRPEKILGLYACDYTRPDWEHRWKEWSSRMNPYLNLFLCAEHAKKLGLKV
jgi:hypothetical protein